MVPGRGSRLRFEPPLPDPNPDQRKYCESRKVFVVVCLLESANLPKTVYQRTIERSAKGCRVYTGIVEREELLTNLHRSAKPLILPRTQRPPNYGWLQIFTRDSCPWPWGKSSKNASANWTKKLFLHMPIWTKTVHCDAKIVKAAFTEDKWGQYSTLARKFYHYEGLRTYSRWNVM